jgi:hypothetical protein
MGAGHKRFYELLDEMGELHSRKNQDYADSESDPLRNFREAEGLGISAFQGTLVRISDKWIRIRNLASRDRGPAVVDESIRDTLLDLANYALIALILHEEQEDVEAERKIEELPLSWDQAQPVHDAETCEWCRGGMVYEG